MDISVLKNICSKIGTTKRKEFADYFDMNALKLLISIDPNLDNYTVEHFGGAAVEAWHASLMDCQLGCYPRVEEIPIVYSEKEAKFILKKERPEPKRPFEPHYEDINLALNLFSRERLLAILNEANQVALRIGKSFCLLTVEDFPCDYFPEGFMTDRSKPKGDDNEYNIKGVITKIPKHDDTKTVVTVWAEGSKAMGRYHTKMGFDRVIVVYPSDFPSHKHDIYKGFCEKDYPTLTIDRVDVCHSSILEKMSSEDFIATYNLPKDAYYLCNYLPQFMNLRYGFSGFACVYSDEEVVDCSEVCDIPMVDSDLSYRLDYYANWIRAEKESSIVDGHAGFYDPVKRIRVSYSQHGCFEDKIRNISDFGKGDVIVHYVSNLMNWESGSKMKMAYGCKDVASSAITHFETLSNMNSATSAIGLDIDYSNFVASDQATYDLSRIHPGDEGVVYLPMIPLTEFQTTNYGELLVKGVTYRGFPPDRTVRVGFMGNDFVVADILFGRKRFFDRRDLIPVDYRLPYSTTLKWSYCYVNYLNSAKPVGEYGLCSKTLIRTVGIGKEKEQSIHKFPEIVIPGFGWNKNICKLVYDSDSYIYASPYDFSLEKRPSTRYMEFDTQYAIRTALRFNFCELVCEIPGSKSTKIVDVEAFEDLLEKGFHPSHRDQFKREFLKYYCDMKMNTVNAEWVGTYSFSEIKERDRESYFRAMAGNYDKNVCIAPIDFLSLDWSRNVYHFSSSLNGEAIDRKDISVRVDNKFVICGESGNRICTMLYFKNSMF